MSDTVAAEPAQRGGPGRRPWPGPGDPYVRVTTEVARCFRVMPRALTSPERRGARETLARHVAMYLLNVVHARPYREIGERFGRHRTSVLYACARIEDRRDDPAFDRKLLRLECSLADSGRGQ
ncbi:DnaA-like protein [Tepidamorphus gemmatus]|uniref:DnaA-like protein n=1 Tax=Tepidamorphus gemmatus TaxID=747076 RepID=A0A4R3LZG5_9HYPH|nr:helix-turn-helix domain-containing protein [Tepidamorphus gemmatus]TCT04157.1 DnaA-like protein [Tepidamorphus gemmatus]